MAEPISAIKKLQLSNEEIKNQNVEEILDAVSENKQAVLKVIHLASALEENGTLDFLTALVKQKEEGLNNVMKELNKDQYTNTLENASDLIFLIGDLDLSKLKELTGRLNEGMEEALTVDENEKTSYTGMLKALKEPEINHSITMFLTFLRGMGRSK